MPFNSEGHRWSVSHSKTLQKVSYLINSRSKAALQIEATAQLLVHRIKITYIAINVWISPEIFVFAARFEALYNSPFLFCYHLENFWKHHAGWRAGFSVRSLNFGCTIDVLPVYINHYSAIKSGWLTIRVLIVELFVLTTLQSVIIFYGGRGLTNVQGLAALSWNSSWKLVYDQPFFFYGVRIRMSEKCFITRWNK